MYDSINKYFRLIIIIITLTIMYSACCVDDRYPCPPANPKFIFMGIDSAQTDTILLLSFEKNSQFTNPIDSLKFSDVTNYNGTLQHDTLYFYIPNDPLMTDSMDWVIRLTNPTQEFQITDIQHEDKTCGCKRIFFAECFNRFPSVWASVDILAKLTPHSGETDPPKEIGYGEHHHLTKLLILTKTISFEFYSVS
ncbi:MAG: hypothetical protein K9I85_16245, partial [Saprospiraceae bacterium]|nr:hypothetical protein [Saprospiraceae bacterium]